MRYSKKNINLLLLCLAYVLCASAQVNKYSLVRTPQNVTVNRKLPKNILAPDEPVRATFSKEPKDEEIYRIHFFEEPLVPAEGSSSVEENNALIYALAGFSQRTSSDNFRPVTEFLNTYPQSRWRGALLANLGIIYRRSGYFNKAMEAWEQAWLILKNQNEHKAKVLADRVVSELLLINSWVGRVDRIAQLLAEIDQRTMEGPAVERVSSMRTALWTMKKRPGVSFKCGPYALNKIFAIHDSTHAYNDTLMAVQSTSRGFSLTELEKLAKAVHLDYQMAFRTPGSAVIPNAVVHWKLDHYSALIKLENGQFKCQDATMGTVYGQEFWLAQAALDSSASGYFLVPKGPLPQGWRQVTESEGSKVYGKGQEIPDNGKHVSPDDAQEPKQCNAKPMAQANVHLLAVSLHIYDQPVYYTPPVGPAMLFNIDYHQRDSYQPANFSFSNLGPKWTFNWLSFVKDDPNNTSANADVYVMGGGARTFISFNTATQSYAPELQTNDMLVRVCPTCYEVRHPDGSKEIYARPDGNTSAGRKIFLTKRVDAAGNAMTISYDNNLRIIALKDAIGQVTTITYGQTSDSYKITKVTDPFGRFAGFQYDASGRLIKITDMIGIVSSFQYDAAGDFINKMTTPYGSTGFTKTEGNGVSTPRVLETTYPLGEKERVEYLENATGVKMSEQLTPTGMSLLNTYLVYRNSFFWDKKAMKDAPGDYTKAKIYHWLHGSGSLNESGTAAPVLESMKQPLESRVWYFYQGQSYPIVANQGMSAKPSQIGRVLDDSSTQLSLFSYNSLGKITSSTDPMGRKMTYTYDSTNINLLEVRQTTNSANDLLAAFTYNSQYLPVTAKDASGLVTRYTYNTAGQLTKVTNPKNETTALAYNANGYLLSITGPIAGSTVSFTYDGYGRTRTVTDQQGYTVTTDYDALNRLTLITFPDSTFEQTVYDRLDPVHTKDRFGRWSHSMYDSLDRANAVIDALGRVSQFIWCSCGSLSEIVDPMKNITTFTRDLQGRVILKTFHDGTSISYKYENFTSRLKEVTDPKGQKTQYSYYQDNNLKQEDYVNAVIATPSVAYTYDSNYNRMATMTDGTGKTTYTYQAINLGLGSGQLSAIDGPLSNDIINYVYDSLGRINKRSINGVASAVVFDKLGRITAETNVLGTFSYKYLNQTERLASINYPNGQSTVYDYFDNKGDQRLKQIWNKTSVSGTLSKFNYEYNNDAQITRWTQQSDASTPNYYDVGYDLSNQLTSATLKNQSTSAVVKRYAYQYDKSGNRTSEQLDNTITSAEYNNLNQLTGRQNQGPIRVKGKTSKFSSVLVKNITAEDSLYAPVDSVTNSFEVFVKTIPGTNNITVTAADYSGNNNKKINSYNITVGSGVNDTLTFDANGNTLRETNPAVTYGWDAADRLVKITKGGNVTEFVYDGLSRRVSEKLNGTVIKRWLWCGTELCEERNASGATVTKRFFTQGEQIGGVNYYFTKDHLGSVIEMTDASGALKARYSYDPYGRRTKVSGSLDADFGFTGHYYHSTSGLYLAMYRAYDANLGRWLNRDPLFALGRISRKETSALQLLKAHKFGNGGSDNLYQYVYNRPITYVDKFGLRFGLTQQQWCVTSNIFWIGAGVAGVVGGIVTGWSGVGIAAVVGGGLGIGAGVTGLLSCYPDDPTSPCSQSN